MRLTGLEVAPTDATYAWRVEDGMTAFSRVAALAHATDDPVRIRHAIRESLDALDPDAVAIPSYSTPDAHAALAWCRRHRRVAVMMFDSRAEDAARSAWREAVKRALVREFDAALVAGTPQAAYATALGLPPACIFAPLDVVDNDHFAALPNRAPRPGPDHQSEEERSPYILSVNRFTARKNVGVLVRAYGEYRRYAPAPWPLVLVGDGPEREALERLAAPTPGITFTGFQQIDQLPVWYRGAGVYVHPAQSDPWGLVVNEAMAAGLPVLVSTGAGCAPDLVAAGENGHTFAPDDASTLAHHLAAVTGDPTTRARMSRRSKQIVAQYTPDHFAVGMLRAVDAGRARSDRSMGVAARLVLRALAWAGRRPDSFHSVES